ncbi:MAG TPA: hypothetical protein PLY87_17375 [Planctomycetaceae bacterium]|nr:hypothetical protein [Planctomycetaceae bacterium]
MLDTTTGTERHPLTVPELGESISEFAIDSTGTLFATSDGSDLYLTRTESEQTETKYVAAYVDIASPVTALNFAAGDTVLLVGTKTGLTVLDLTTPRPQQLEQFSIGEVSAIRETSDGYVLVQRPDGILRYAMQNLLPPTCRQTAGASTEPTHEESVEQEVVVSFSDLRRTNPVLPLSSTPAYSYSATKVYETDLFGRVERTEWSYVQPGNEGTVTYTFLDGPRYVSSIQFARSTAPQMYRGASVTLAGQFFPLQLIASDESTQSIGVNSLVSSMTIRMPTGYHPQPPTQFIFPIDVELLGTTQTLTRHVLDNATPLDGSMFETGLSYSSFFDHTVTSGSVIRMSDSIQVQVGNAGGQDIAVHDGVLQPVSGLGGLKLQSLLGPLQVTSVQVIRSNSQGRVYLLASIGEFGLPAIDVTSGGEFDLDEKIETLELVTQDGAAAGFGTIRAHLTPGDGKELRDSDTIISSPLSLLTAGLRRGVVTLAHPQLGRMSIFAGSGGFTVRSGGTVHAGGGSDREEWNHPDSLTIRFLDAPAKLLALDLARNDWTWFGNYQGRNMSGVKITGFLNGVEQFSRYDFIPGRKMAAGIIDTLIVETSSAGRSVLLANLIAEITEERIVSVGAPADPAPQMPPIPTDDGYVPQNYWTPPASAEPIQNPLNPSISGARKAIELLNQKPQKQLSQEQSTTHRHNLSVILQSEGLGSPEERAAGYIAANPDAVLVLKAFSTGLQAIIIQMLQDRSVAQISEDTAARVHDEAIELLRALLNVDVGIGGDGTSPIPLDTPTMLNVAAVVEEVARANSANPGAALRKSLSWFRDSAGSPTIFGFDTNRIAGRILVGVYQATLDVTTEAAIEKFATVEYLTGILTAEMLRAWRKPSTFRSALLRLADRNHYDVLQASTNNITYPVRVDADKQSYTNQYMRVTINPPIMNSSLTHFRAYLYSVDHTTPYREITAGNVVGRLFTDVAVELFGQQTVQGSIKAAVWYFGNTIGYGGFSPHSVTVQWDGTCQSASNDFSTTPADTPANQTRRASENEILRQVIAHFQKQLNDGTWHWTIGSPFHQSADYYALDLNRSSNDYGLDLFAIGEGTITQVGTGENRDLSLGEVRISHTVIVPGQGEKTWIERHYHLPLEQRIVLRADGSEVTEVHVVIRQDENVSVHEEMALLRNENSILTDRQIQDLYDQMNPVRKNGDKNREWAISEGMHADPSSPMGAVGKNGGKDKNGKFILVGAHDHLSILADGKTIDPRLIIEELVESHEMSAITVYDDRNIETKVIWRSDLEWNGVKGLWWSEELHAALDRSDQINGADVNGTSAFWIAWHADPNQRERLTWRKVKLTDDSGVQQEKFAWIGTTAIGQTRRWNDQQWIFLLQ